MKLSVNAVNLPASVSVTVIIVNWNGGTLLQSCLSHLLKQTFMPARILVMDNGSSDGSAELADKTPGITVFRLGSNLGFAAANNLAIQQCDTEWVALLNPDAFPESDWLERLVMDAQTNPTVAAFGSRQMSHYLPQMLDGIGDIYHISGLVWRNGYGRPYSSSKDISQKIFSPCACAALYRSAALLDAGGFDEDFFCYVEDVDLGFRLRLVGHASRFVADAVVHHVGSATSGGRHSDFSVYHGHRNLVWSFVKNMPGILFWVLLPLHVAMNLAIIVFFALSGQGKTIVRAKWDALKGIPKMWQKRKDIQAKRKASAWDIWRALDKRLTPSRQRSR